MIETNSFIARIELCKRRGIINSLLPGIIQNGIIEQRGNDKHDAKGRFASKGGSAKLGKTERKRVSSAILTDHPNYKPGETHSKFHGSHYYRFKVKEPGSYFFTMRLKIVGNEEKIRWIEKEWKNG